MIGDKLTDIEAGRAAGVGATILVGTDALDGEICPRPDYAARDLPEAVTWLLERSGLARA